jgi:hypothetical protein
MRAALALGLMVLLCGIAKADAPKPIELHADPAPPPLSAPCARELYGPVPLCRRLPSLRHFECLVAHRAELSEACQKLLQDNGR